MPKKLYENKKFIKIYQKKRPKLKIGKKKRQGLCDKQNKSKI